VVKRRRRQVPRFIEFSERTASAGARENAAGDDKALGRPIRTPGVMAPSSCE
jgi:hypothetical protein